MLTNACTAKSVEMPIASSRPNSVAASRATRRPAPSSTTYSPITERAPMTPISSATTAKIASVCASGRNPHLAIDAPGPTPNQPPFEMLESEPINW